MMPIQPGFNLDSKGISELDDQIIKNETKLVECLQCISLLLYLLSHINDYLCHVMVGHYM